MDHERKDENSNLIFLFLLNIFLLQPTSQNQQKKWFYFVPFLNSTVKNKTSFKLFFSMLCLIGLIKNIKQHIQENIVQCRTVGFY